MPRIIGLAQARMGSSRLPGKVMLPLAGKPLIGHIFDRLAATPGIDGLVLATTADIRNDALVAYAESRGIPVYRETVEDDIVARLAGAARLMRADAVLKVNADCPMVDPAIMARLVQSFRGDSTVDYVSNKIVWTWPEGMSAEVIATAALVWCADNLQADIDRELVANWIRDHTDRFTRRSVEADRDYMSLPKLSVDTPADYAEATRIFAALYPSNALFGFNDILAWLKAELRSTY